MTALQQPQLGTGHAVQQAAPLIGDDGMALILFGDVPLIEAALLRDLIRASGGHSLALLSIELPEPFGYGRVLRAEDGSVRAIVEQKDATPEQQAITECYSGIMAAPAALLKQLPSPCSRSAPIPKRSRGSCFSGCPLC